MIDGECTHWRGGISWGGRTAGAGRGWGRVDIGPQHIPARSWPPIGASSQPRVTKALGSLYKRLFKPFDKFIFFQSTINRVHNMLIVMFRMFLEMATKKEIIYSHDDSLATSCCRAAVLVGLGLIVGGAPVAEATVYTCNTRANLQVVRTEPAEHNK